MDALLELAESAVHSPWIYLAVLVLVFIDGFFPTAPGEAIVVTCGVFAAQGQPSAVWVIVAAAVGGLAGDQASYWIGRGAGGRLLRRKRGDSRRRAPLRWATRTLDQRGAGVLVVCRFIPCARTAVTLTCGACRYPLGPFTLFTAIGAACWATYFTLIGMLGGTLFRDSPWLGVLLGIGLAMVVGALVEFVRTRRRGPEDEDSPEAVEHPGPSLPAR